METAPPNTIAQFVPLIILCLAIAGTAFALAKDKGRNVPLWTVLGLIPVLNFFLIWYFVGASNLKHEAKLNEILARMNRRSPHE
ncbi:Unannotated [Lentimonas sp. CC19]|nr:Unannotated [Lentimonas sp. CC10]CAA6697337.1 Unannotated [Lentimonas sp. CC19]CAA7072250.1 Unannotated [Lentimonas sp. CC11]